MPDSALRWLATPDTACLRNLWAGRLTLSAPWQSSPHATAETALLCMAGEATVTLRQGNDYAASGLKIGIPERASSYHNWPRGDLLFLPPHWQAHITPRTSIVEMLVFQAWLPETMRGR